MDKKIIEREEKFHDMWADSQDISKVMPIETFTACTSPENRLIWKWLGGKKGVKGKKLLELGCGLGEASTYFAMNGAEVTATDLSGEMLKVAQKVAEAYGARIETQKCSADQLPFGDNTFDIVYVANLFHHVDIDKTVSEVYRVLKKGGILVSWDPLAHNPIINIYRRMASEVRTDDEHPLKIRELYTFKKYFPKVKYDCKWFFTNIIFLKFFLINRVGVNEERYWKKIIIEHKQLEPLYNKLEAIDNKLLNIFPALKKYCWNIVIYCQK